MNFSEESEFASLSAGDYKIYLIDAAGCRDTLGFAIEKYTSGLSADVIAAPDSQCLGSNGSLTVTAAAEKPPYKYSLNGSAFVTTNEFQNLEAGRYQIVVSDDASCVETIEATVPRAPTGVRVGRNTGRFPDTMREVGLPRWHTRKNTTHPVGKHSR